MNAGAVQLSPSDTAFTTKKRKKREESNFRLNSPEFDFLVASPVT
jgi:hypothetical protein